VSPVCVRPSMALHPGVVVLSIPSGGRADEGVFGCGYLPQHREVRGGVAHLSLLYAHVVPGSVVRCELVDEAIFVVSKANAIAYIQEPDVMLRRCAGDACANAVAPAAHVRANGIFEIVSFLRRADADQQRSYRLVEDIAISALYVGVPSCTGCRDTRPGSVGTSISQISGDVEARRH